MPSCLLPEAVHHAQAEVAAIADILRREERIIGLLDHFVGHPRPRIGKAQRDKVSGGHLIHVAWHVVLGYSGVRARDEQAATLGHGIASVERKVQHHVLEL